MPLRCQARGRLCIGTGTGGGTIEIRHRRSGKVLLRVRAGTLGGLNLQGENLEGADLPGAWLLATFLRGANLSCANLRKTTLLQADLEAADLSGADLRDADLSSASLQQADLRAADLTGADLTDAKVAGARYDVRTRWPAGFDPQPQGAELAQPGNSQRSGRRALKPLSIPARGT